MEHSRSLRGILKKYARPLSDGELHDARKKALERAAGEDWNREDEDPLRNTASALEKSRRPPS